MNCKLPKDYYKNKINDWLMEDENKDHDPIEIVDEIGTRYTICKNCGVKFHPNF